MDSKWIQNFAPSWFAVVMGTGILAMTSLQYATMLPLLGFVASGLAIFNIIVFFILLIPWILRWIFYPKEASDDLKHPNMSNFYPTMTIALVVLAAHFGQFGFSSLAFRTWLLGALGTVIFSILIPYEMFKKEEIAPEHISPAWFIPPVALIVIPLVGGPFIAQASGLMQEFLILLNYFGFGAGFLLYISLLAICLYRFIIHHPMPNTMAPTVWISLGPIGAGTVAVVNVITNSSFVTVKEPFFIMGFLFWSFGIWWLFMAIIMTVHYIRRLTLPYAMTWWAFIFPLGAFVAGCHVIGQTLGFQLIDFIGFGLYWLLFTFWIITSIGLGFMRIHKKDKRPEQDQ
ncbi:MAG: tellurite-resistance/dicarboxylate transporter [Candidatus Thorarchaeota archaeon]|nr:tellurite-resistance/dicarboxylate transporter [Candidatus Thorarchaeota archaeon]